MKKLLKLKKYAKEMEVALDTIAKENPELKKSDEEFLKMDYESGIISEKTYNELLKYIKA